MADRFVETSKLAVTALSSSVLCDESFNVIVNGAGAGGTTGAGASAPPPPRHKQQKYCG